MDKIKISEKEVYNKLCCDCDEPRGKLCDGKNNCSYIVAIKKLNVFEIIPEKTALELAEYEWKNFEDNYCWIDTESDEKACYFSIVINLISMYEQAIKELQEQINEK